MSKQIDLFPNINFVNPMDHVSQKRYVKQFFYGLSWSIFTLFRSNPSQDWNAFFQKKAPLTLKPLFPQIRQSVPEVYRAYCYAETCLLILSKLPETQRNFLWVEEFLRPFDSLSSRGYSRSGIHYEQIKSYSLLVRTIREDEEIHDAIDALMEDF